MNPFDGVIILPDEGVLDFMFSCKKLQVSRFRLRGFGLFAAKLDCDLASLCKNVR